MEISNIIQNFIEETTSNSLIDKIEPLVMLVGGIGLLICGILWIRVWKKKQEGISHPKAKAMGIRNAWFI